MEVNQILAIAYRDFTKLLRDRPRLMTSLISPILTVLVLGGSGEAAFDASFNIFHYILVGVMVQSVLTSTAAGMVWLLEDRTNDFSQEIFVSPISRYTIVFGKIAGEMMVAMPPGVILLIMALVVGLPMTLWQFFALFAVLLFASILGGSLGIIVVSNLGTQRSANQIVPWITMPQVLMSGIFFPLNLLPDGAEIFSRIMPLRYPVDLARAIIFANNPEEYAEVVMKSPLHNLLVMTVMFVFFLSIGTMLFVRSERNR